MTDSDLPLALYKANLDLWLRLGELLQDNREQWMQLLTRELRDGIGELRTEAGQAQQAEGWQSLSMLPGSALWRIAEQQVGDLQALMQTAVGNQMTFANGFQNALAEWQETTAGAIGGAAGVQAPGDLMERTLQAISALAPGAAGIAGSAPGAATARTGSTRPAAKAAATGGGSSGAGRTAPARKRAARAAESSTAGRAKTAKKTARKAAKKTATKKTASKAAKKATTKRPAKKAATKRATKKSRK